MQVHTSLSNLPVFKNAVVTIGTFDGVHLGHQQILAHLKNEAAAINGETVVITFNPHPRNIVGDTTGVQLLTTLDEKIALLQAAGIHHLVVVAFNDAFANQTAQEYVTNFLYQKFRPHTFIIGYDHRFGQKRTGNYQLLETMGKQLGFVVKEIPQQLLNEAAISSTQIRKALLHSNTQTANALLGYPYFFSGTVIQGDKIGRTIGYPTANLQMIAADKLVPGDGVYAVLANRSLQIGDSSSSKSEGSTTNHQPPTANQLQGMMYIGSRPVVNGKRRVIEVNIFDFDEDIYDEILTITVHQFIRGDMQLNGLPALQEQLAKDKLNCENVLSSM
jgi:riboflavin kinase / FMN adenylyltransferase